MPLRPFALVLAVPALVLGLSSCGGDSDKLTIYSGRIESLVGPLIDQFEEQTGIDVEVKYGDSADLAVLVDTEGDKGPDVFFSQTPGALGFLDLEGHLAPLPQATLDKVPARFRAEDGDWVGVSGRVRVINYNADTMDESEVPDSVFDFTKPEYKGRFGVAPPNGSFQDFVTIMRVMRGDDATLEWLKAIKENGARTYANNVDIRAAIERGEIDFGMINHYYNEQAKHEQPDDTPTENHFLNNADDPGSAILTAGASVLKTAGDKSADAQRFVDFLLSEQAQKYFATETFEYPLAAGVAPEGTLPDLDTLTAPPINLSDLGGQLERTRDLIRESGLESS
jgi:iron(III) transport system substrate-binding protein